MQMIREKLNWFLHYESSSVCVKNMFDNASQKNAERRDELLNYEFVSFAAEDADEGEMAKLNLFLLTLNIFDRYLTVASSSYEDYPRIYKVARVIAEICILGQATSRARTVESNFFISMVHVLGAKFFLPIATDYFKLVEEYLLLKEDNVWIEDYWAIQSNIFTALQAAMYDLNFACLPASYQVAALLRYFDLWNPTTALLLNKEEDVVKMSYGILTKALVLSRRSKLPFELKETFEFNRDDLFGQIKYQKKEKALNSIGSEEFEERFENLKYLGKGSYGMVSKYHDLLLDNEVVIKEIQIGNTKYTDYDQFEELFSYVYLTDAHGFVKLREAFVVVDNGVVKRILMIMDEYTGTLRDYVKDPKNPRLAERPLHQKWTRELLKSMKEMHIRSISHNDYKAENILLDSNKETFVSDFGLTRLIRQGFFRPIYTVDYRPPECFVHPRQPTVDKSDIWALGVTLIYIKAGTKLINGSRGYDDDIVGGQLEYLFNLKFKMKTKKVILSYDLNAIYYTLKDPELEDLLSHMLNPNPETRWNVLQCLDHPYVN